MGGLDLIVVRNTDIDKLEFRICNRNTLTVKGVLDLRSIDHVTLIANIIEIQKEIVANTLTIKTRYTNNITAVRQYPSNKHTSNKKKHRAEGR